MSGLFDLTGKVAVVTGGSSGLGVQFAKALARQGANVAIVARRVLKLRTIKGEIEALGVKCLEVQCDVSKVHEIRAAVTKIKEHFGTIDILVNNAGIGLFGPAEEQTDDLWESMMSVNLNSVYYFSREVGKIMINKGYGKIINIGSIHSTVAMTGLPLSAYCTTKGGVEMLTKALANEWAKHNITVNAIGPAYFPSEMTNDVIEDGEFKDVIKAYCPMGRAGREGELDGAIVYFASDASSYTTGQLLTIDGGWTTI
jgi:NAD(P)-dependent dehydrogenase (short-subunit alcohol dehydrogenase family)